MIKSLSSDAISHVEKVADELGASQVFPSIEKLPKDPVPFVRKTAIIALKKIADKSNSYQPH